MIRARIARIGQFGIGLGLFTLAILGLRSVLGREQHLTTLPLVPIAPPTAQIVTLQTESIARTAERHARLLPVQEWSLSLQVGGRVLQRPQSNGARVGNGELLLALDPEPFDAELQRAQAACQEADARRRLAEMALTRMERLRQSNSASSEQLDQSRADRDGSVALAAAAAASFRAAQFQRKHTQLLAPCEGILSDLTVEVGQYVPPGAVIGRYSRVETLLIRVLVPWNIRRGISEGAPAEIIDGRQRTFTARLARAAAVQSGDSGQFELEFEIANPDGQLLAGEPVRCRFPYGQAEATVRVPRQALYEQYGQWRALVPGPMDEKSGMIEARSVSVVLGGGDPTQGWVIIDDGLEAGDRILVPPRVSGLREGQRCLPRDVPDAWLPPYATSSADAAAARADRADRANVGADDDDEG